MEYSSILKRIEEQKKDQQLSEKVFRYAGLIKAIEFFSQKLNFDQIIDAAFDFINELLMLQKSAIFIMQGNNFVLKKLKGQASEVVLIKDNQKLQDLGRFNGSILYENEYILKYFERSVIECYDITLVIPLIIEDMLFGFIFISNKVVGELNSDDYIIAEALMKLFNNALENCKRYEELQHANRELDEKIFNLFAINQSSKALLSELSLDVLYTLSVDVFSELTQSSITGFVLYDERSEKYKLKAFKDVYYKDLDTGINLTLNKSARVDIGKVIIDVSNEKDMTYFNHIFSEGIEMINLLKSQFIILLIKNGKILGFVSLGATVTGMEYKKGMFELTESLASAAYIALSNAQLFRQVNEQKKIIEGKLDKLMSLNKLMKNINSSLTKDILMDLTLKTLDISFDVEKALIATYDKESNAFYVEKTLGLEMSKSVIKVNSNWKRVLEGDTVFEAKEAGISKYISKTVLKDLDKSAGILILPICIDRAEIEVLGVIIVFKYKKISISDDEYMLTMETIAGHIAPVMSNLISVEEQKNYMIPNYKVMFQKDLKTEVEEALDLCLYLDVIHIEVLNSKFTFAANNYGDKLSEHFKRVYPVSQNDIFIINNKRDDTRLDQVKKLIDLKKAKVNMFVLGKDFNTYQQFIKMY